MDHTITLIGVGVGFMQGIIIFVLMGFRSDMATLKQDMKDMWKRTNSHYHEVSCSNDECKSLKTGNVIIPRESGG
jgi:hypothetical protein